MVSNVLDRMNSTRMSDLVNFVILSDHGMAYGSTPMLAGHQIANFPFDKFKV